MLRVALADGHRILRDALTLVLEGAGDLVVVGSYGTGQRLVESAAEATPDVVVLEARLPDGSGFEYAEIIKHSLPDVSIIILTSSHSDADLAVALEAGVDGYLYKECSAEEFLRAVRGAGRTGFFASPRAAEHMRDMATHGGDGLLTPRELEVLFALRDGLTTDEMGEKLFLSASTVKTHLGNIYRKLGARNRVEAMREAERRGIIPED